MRFNNIKLSYTLTKPTVVSVPIANFPLDARAATSPYLLKSIDGLGPPDIDHEIQYQASSGTQYLGSKPGIREIVMVVGYQPNYAIGQTSGDLRAELNRLISPPFGIPMLVTVGAGPNSSGIAMVEGRIKRIEANVLSEDPEAQVVITCYGPYLRLWGIDLPNVGTMAKNPISIPCNGDAPSGFSMEINITGSTDRFRITNENGDKLEVVKNFFNGDQITFDTTPGRRTIRLIRAGDDTNLLPYQVATSTWPQLWKGTNKFTTNMVTTSFWIGDIKVNENYWGV